VTPAGPDAGAGREPVDDVGLPAELCALRDRAGVFARGELVPTERRHGLQRERDATPELCRWVRERSAALGLFRLAQPVELGGGGLGPLGQAAVREEIAASGALLGGLVLGGDGGLLRLGTPEQRERFLLPVLRGELTAAFAFTDAREGPRTSAVRRGDSYALSGVKAFVTGGVAADLLVTVARVTDGGDGPTGTALFVVRRDAPGLTLRRERHTLDGSAHGEFEYAGVPVAAADVLGEIGAGLPRALDNIAAIRLRVAAVACGAGRWALEETLHQVDRPHRTGTALAEREQVQAMIADSAMDLYAARAALYAAARRAEPGPAPGPRWAEAEVEVAMAKALATEAVTRIVDRAMQLTGAGAVVEDHPLAVLYRRARAWRIGEGTTEMLRLTVARGLLSRRRAGRSGGEP